MVTAYKNGETRQFSDLQWSLLGAKKCGWTEITEAQQPLSQTIPSKIEKFMDEGIKKNVAVPVVKSELKTIPIPEPEPESKPESKQESEPEPEIKVEKKKAGRKAK